MSWTRRLREIDQRAIRRWVEEEAKLSGEGWKLVFCYGILTAVSTILFLLAHAWFSAGVAGLMTGTIWDSAWRMRRKLSRNGSRNR
jgi:Flp pilus assembly protein TadB